MDELRKILINGKEHLKVTDEGQSWKDEADGKRNTVEVTLDSKIDPCGVCGKRVMANSVLCTICCKRIHARCTKMRKSCCLFDKRFCARIVKTRARK